MHSTIWLVVGKVENGSKRNCRQRHLKTEVYLCHESQLSPLELDHKVNMLI